MNQRNNPHQAKKPKQSAIDFAFVSGGKIIILTDTTSKRKHANHLRTRARAHARARTRVRARVAPTPPRAHHKEKYTSHIYIYIYIYKRLRPPPPLRFCLPSRLFPPPETSSRSSLRPLQKITGTLRQLQVRGGRPKKPLTQRIPTPRTYQRTTGHALR